MQFNRKLFLFTAFPALFAVALLAGLMVSGWLEGSTFLRMADAEDAGRLPEVDQTGFSEAANQVTPYTVQIRTILRQDAVQSMQRLDFDAGTFSGAAMEEESPALVFGSGIILSEEGLIATVLPVVRNARRITVILSDGETVDAELVGYDWATGVALLQTGPLPTGKEPLETMVPARIGQWVVAMGSPFGAAFSNSLTAGIISGERAIPFDKGTTLRMLQTDVALEEGSLGGPLVSLDGRLVGMNVIPSTIGDTYLGIGYALDAASLQHVVSIILDRLRSDRGWLGITFRSYEGTGALSGVLEVVEVHPSSGARQAGIRSGDLIVGINNVRLESPTDLEHQLDQAKPGDRVVLDIHRQREELRIDVTLGWPPAPSDQIMPVRNRASSEQMLRAEQGISLGRLTNEIKHDFDLFLQEGVVLLSAEPSGLGYIDSDLRAGMVISEIADQPVRSPEDFYAIYEKIPSGNFFLLMVHKPFEHQSFLTAMYRP